MARGLEPGCSGRRVVVLLGAPGAGKSVLADGLLRAAGAPAAPRPDPERLAHAALVHRGVRISLLDPPGAADLAGDLHAGLRGAAAALLVVSPVQGVDARSVQLWELCERAGLPRLVVLTQLDRAGADADEAVAVCQRLLGEAVLPLQLPLHDDAGEVAGLLDLLALQVSENGAHRPADPEHVRLVTELRAELLEAVLTGSEHDRLFDDWLAGREPGVDALRRELPAAVARGELHPVAVVAPPRGVGLADLLDLLVDGLPDAATQVPPAVTTPAGEPLPPLAADPAGPLAAEVLRGGDEVLLRVWSGTLRPGAPVLVGDRGAQAYRGPETRAAEVCEVRLAGRPADPVCAVEQPLVLAPWPVPAPQFPVGAADDPGLSVRVERDPVARLSRDPRTGQLLLWTAGPQHADLLLQGAPALPVVVPPDAPPARVRVRVPRWCAATVRSDLVGRGGELLAGAEAEDGVALTARLPAAELVGYAPVLSRLSAGTGSLERLPD